MKIKKVFRLSIFMIICGVILVLIAFAIPWKRTFKGPGPKIPIEIAKPSIEDKLLPSPLVIITEYLPDGRVGLPYEVDIKAKGGSGNYNFSITSGKLPKGLNLSTKGTISGIPDKDTDGGYDFVVEVIDSKNKKTEKGFNLTIYPPVEGKSWIKYPETKVCAMCPFKANKVVEPFKKHAIYAGTGLMDSGIWRSEGDNFIKVYSTGLIYGSIPLCKYAPIIVFKDKLYIAVNLYIKGKIDSSMIYRSGDGQYFYASPGTEDFGDPSNEGISAMATYKENLYAATWNFTNGPQICRTYDGINWEKVYQYKPVPNPIEITSMAEFKHILYTTTGYNSSNILRFNGNDWEVKSVKVKDSFCQNTYLLEVFKGHLYLVDSPQGATGYAKIFRSPDGINWEKVFEFDTPQPRIKAVTKSNSRIYFGVDTNSVGTEAIYFDGENWGTSPIYNDTHYKVSSMAMFGDYLYVGMEPTWTTDTFIYRIYENYIE